MNNKFCINKSGSEVEVYSSYNKNHCIGTIYNREAFGCIENVEMLEYQQIQFRNKLGSLQLGWLYRPTAAIITPCIKHLYGTAKINGVSFYTFMMRRKETIYKADATVWGEVLAGKMAACTTAASGEMHPTGKLISYVQHSSTGAWIKVDFGGNGYGFVNTGLDYGSEWSTIPFYGSW